MTTDLERFTAAVFTGPLLRADAIVVLGGEDGLARANVALELFKQGAAQVIVCSGGLHDPPHRVGGAALGAHLLSQGIAPDRILVESWSQNTYEQAVNVVELAVANDWKRLLLVASPYHVPRAMLTFIKAVPDTIQIVPVPAAQLPWFTAPPGMEATRLTLLDSEQEKIDRYTEHVASPADGLAYLERWEGK